MKYLWPSWRRLLARALVLVLALGAVPINCLAAEPAGPPQSSPTLAAAIQQAVQQETGKVTKVTPNAARQSGAPAAAESGSFFKTKTGVITLVLLAAGTGYALYSTSHDRITSPKVPYGGTWK